MTRKLDLKVGQKVVVRYINDRIRYTEDRSIDNIDDWTTKGEITTIGRKYIQVNMGVYSEKFEIGYDYIQKVSMGLPDYKLYLSKQEIIDEIKGEELYNEASKHFNDRRNNNRFTIDQLNRILSVIKEEGCNNE